MALAFQTATVTILDETGVETKETTVTFPREIKKDAQDRPIAQVAIQSFKLDLLGNARPTDIMQVTASSRSGGDSVVVRVKTNYSGGAYTGEVTVLVIADLRD